MTETTDAAGLAISVRNIGKRYSIGTGRRGASILDRFGRIAGGRDRDPFSDSFIWALRDVSFDVSPGHVVGLLGRNGSGKTTLVRVLSRITAPTEGTAIVNGRVGALFQVGTGFHPELSGRENIGLSGAVLGMSDEETAARFDDIVDFAEIGDFLDAPVKFYSSGMLARLAFGVSSHLAADILLIDEALSVGDIRFREKCALRIDAMVKSGRTVIYVSHSLDTVSELCDRAIVLDAGQVRYSGEVEDALAFYHELSASVQGAPLPRSVFDSRT